MAQSVGMKASAHGLGSGGMAICGSNDSGLVDVYNYLFRVPVAKSNGREETRLGEATVIMMKDPGCDVFVMVIGRRCLCLERAFISGRLLLAGVSKPSQADNGRISTFAGPRFDLDLDLDLVHYHFLFSFIKPHPSHRKFLIFAYPVFPS